MRNEHIEERLLGILSILRDAHKAGGCLSAATKGREREVFVNTFLSQMLPPPFRFGTGDITDHLGNRSGQMDVVIEYPFVPSLPLCVGAYGSPRLYLAEGVAAVIEVKSNLQRQWSEVLNTASQLGRIQTRFDNTESHGPNSREKAIPFFVVGYEGWKTVETVRDKLSDTQISGISVIDPGVFVSNSVFNNIAATGAWSLWGLIRCLYDATNRLIACYTDLGRYEA